VKGKLAFQTRALLSGARIKKVSGDFMKRDLGTRNACRRHRKPASWGLKKRIGRLILLIVVTQRKGDVIISKYRSVPNRPKKRGSEVPKIITAQRSIRSSGGLRDRFNGVARVLKFNNQQGKESGEGFFKKLICKHSTRTKK